MSYTQTFIQARDYNNGIIDFPVLTDGTLKLPMHSPAGCFPTYSVSNVLSRSVPDNSVDWLQFQGSGTKTAFITRISVSMLPYAGVGLTNMVGVARRDATYAAGGGGTLENLLSAGTPPNGASPAYSKGNTPTVAVTAAKTVAATSNPTGGFIDAGLLYGPNAASQSEPLEWTFGDRGQQPLIVSGVSDFVVLTFGQATTTGPREILASIEWYEV